MFPTKHQRKQLPLGITLGEDDCQSAVDDEKEDGDYVPPKPIAAARDVAGTPLPHL